MYLWQVGEIVRETLAKRPGVFKIPATGLEIFVVRGFFSAAECEGLIERIDEDLHPPGCSLMNRIRNSAPARPAT